MWLFLRNSDELRGQMRLCVQGQMGFEDVRQLGI